MPLITISEDSLKGTFTIFDNDKDQFVLSERNNTNFSEDQIFDILGEDLFNSLISGGKYDFKIANKKLY